MPWYVLPVSLSFRCLFDGAEAEAPLGGRRLEPGDVLGGELHPEPVPAALGLGRLGEGLEQFGVQPPLSGDKGPCLCCGGRFGLYLAFFLGGRDDDRGGAFEPLAGLPGGFSLSQSGAGILAALALVQRVVEGEVPQVLGDAGFGVLAAGG